MPAAVPTSPPVRSASRFASLSIRIPLLLIASAFLSALAVGVNSHIQATRALTAFSVDLAVSTSRYRATVVKNLGDRFLSDISVKAGESSTREAFEAFAAAFDGVSAKDALRQHYAAPRLAPGQTKADYLGQEDPTSYALAHRLWHPALRSWVRDRNVNDLLLVAPNGDVIYSVNKAGDFAANLRSETLRSTSAARAFEGALAKAAKDEVQFEDFESYAADGGKASAFLGKAMLDHAGKPLGVFIVGIGDTIVRDRLSTRFGKDGTAYALASDGRLRTAVSARGDYKLFDQTPHGDLVKEAIAKNDTASAFARSLDGSAAFIALTPTTFMGRTWLVAADLMASGIEAENQALALRNGLISLGVLLVLAIVSTLLARRLITGPMNQMREAVGRLASGESADIPGEGRKDELGDLARSLRQVHAAGVAAQQLKSALDCASVNVIVADEAGKIAYCNPAMLAFFSKHAKEFRQQFPNFSGEQMVGATLDQFHRNEQWQQRNVDDTRIRIGTLTIDLKVNRIHDAAGKRIGMITEWHDVSAELAAMREVTAVVEAAVRGDFSGRIPEADKIGAMRDLAAGQNRINTIVEAAMEDFSQTLRQVAEGDLMARVEGDHQGRFAQLASGINDTVMRLSETVATIQRSARDLNRAAGEINAGAADLARRTEEEASSLEETAATTEELAASVKQTADSSKEANELSDKGRKLASDGGGIVREAIQAMERIEEASRKITDIIAVIDDIAFQTNLLALNAAVEAARAGEAGKGFAVVASEVRTLAQRSGQAARDIKDLITGSAGQVVEGVRLVHATGRALDSIVQASGEVAQMIGTIHSAASEQAHGIEEMSTAVARIDEMTQQNSALAEQSAASASELMRQLEQLNALVATFRIDPSQAGAAAPAIAHAQPRPAPATEPERLRELAAQAFVQSRVTPARKDSPRPAPPPTPQPRAAAGGSRHNDDWTEF
jgi:methyl-accepting chemotaxis protein